MPCRVPCRREACAPAPLLHTQPVAPCSSWGARRASPDPIPTASYTQYTLCTNVTSAGRLYDARIAYRIHGEPNTLEASTRGRRKPRLRVRQSTSGGLMCDVVPYRNTETCLPGGTVCRTRSHCVCYTHRAFSMVLDSDPCYSAIAASPSACASHGCCKAPAAVRRPAGSEHMSARMRLRASAESDAGKSGELSTIL